MCIHYVWFKGECVPSWTVNRKLCVSYTFPGHLDHKLFQSVSIKSSDVIHLGSLAMIICQRSNEKWDSRKELTVESGAVFELVHRFCNLLLSVWTIFNGKYGSGVGRRDGQAVEIAMETKIWGRRLN